MDQKSHGPHDLPTSRAVADAIRHYRRIRELTHDELARILSGHGRDVAPEGIRGIEEGRRAITVDDLVSFSHALDVSPVTLLTHIPIDASTADGPLATGVPGDVDQGELRAWMQGRTTLRPEGRLHWFRSLVDRLRIASTHHEDQLHGALEQLRELGALAEQEADSNRVRALHCFVRDRQWDLQQADLALACAEHRLDRLQEPDG